MSIYIKIIFVVLFTLYFIVIDKDLWNCESLLGKFLMIIHHTFAPLSLFSGILFKLYTFNIIFLIVVAISWIISKKCVFSTIHNDLCKYDNDLPFKNVGFNIREFISNKINKKVPLMYELIVVVLVFVYNCYMLYKTNFKNKKKIFK